MPSHARPTATLNLRPRCQKRQQRGFTLIEAIVAMVLIASTGIALFSWINTNIITLNRVQESNAESAATLNAIEYMATVNPMLTPQGRTELGSLRLSWQAQAATEPRDGTGYPYGISLYQLALYQTKISVEKLDGELWFDFTLQQVGYKKVRKLPADF